MLPIILVLTANLPAAGMLGASSTQFNLGSGLVGRVLATNCQFRLRARAVCTNRSQNLRKFSAYVLSQVFLLRRSFLDAVSYPFLCVRSCPLLPSDAICSLHYARAQLRLSTKHRRKEHFKLCIRTTKGIARSSMFHFTGVRGALWLHRNTFWWHLNISIGMHTGAQIPTLKTLWVDKHAADDPAYRSSIALQGLSLQQGRILF